MQSYDAYYGKSFFMNDSMILEDLFSSFLSKACLFLTERRKSSFCWAFIERLMGLLNMITFQFNLPFVLVLLLDFSSYRKIFDQDGCKSKEK